jgi:hypothetical protein
MISVVLRDSGAKAAAICPILVIFAGVLMYFGKLAERVAFCSDAF